MEAKACNCLTQEEKELILANYKEGKLYSYEGQKALFIM